jgi:hypothetical protein
LSEGLSTVKDSWKDFQRLGTVIRTHVVGAFSTLKGAIAATGIGLLIVGLGLIVANFEDIEKWLKKVFPSFQGFGKLMDNLKAAITAFGTAAITMLKGIGTIAVKVFTGDFVGAVNAAKELGAKTGKAFKDAAEAEMQKISIKRFAEKRRQEVEDLENEITKVEAKAGQKRYDLRLKQNEKLRDALTAEGKWDSKELADAIAERENLLREETEHIKADNKKKADDAKAARDTAFQKEIADLKYQQEQRMKVEQSIKGNDTFDLKRQQLEEQKSLALKYGQDIAEINRAIADEELNQRIALNTALADIDAQFNQKRKDGLTGVAAAQQQLANQQATAQDQINKKEQEAASIKEAAENAKRAALATTADALGAAAQLAGEQTAVGKGLAIAQTTISTYTGAQAAFTSLASIPIVGPILGAVAAAAAIASGIANVKRITSVKAPGSAPASPSISNAASGVSLPAINPNMMTGTLVDQAIQQNSNLRQPQRVFVLETDITDTQERVASIEEKAQF